jgi:hypothetical protein
VILNKSVLAWRNVERTGSRAVLVTVSIISSFLSSTAIAGPLSKFTETKLGFEAQSARAIFDIERCLIDWGKYGTPMVYRQPDRPDDVTLLYNSGSGIVIGRIDLKRMQNGTIVRAWFERKEVEPCIKPTN